MAIEETTAAKLRDLKEMPKKVTNPQARWRKEEQHERRDYEAKSEDGSEMFRIYQRQSTVDEASYSCGILWILASGETLTLARYNGPSHIHGEIEYECHIHQATEEAIRAGRKPESHADRTERYQTVDGALDCLMQDYHLTGLKTGPDHPDMFPV